MAKNKRPTKRHQPRARLQNPIGYVIEGMSLLGDYAMELHEAMLKQCTLEWAVAEAKRLASIPSQRVSPQKLVALEQA